MRIVIDDVIYQLQKNRPRGISRMWSNIIPHIKEMLKPHELILVHREGAVHKDFELETHTLPNYSYHTRKEDMGGLDTICKNLKIDLFISTYYTRAPCIKSLVFVHDMIPERRNFYKTRPQFHERADNYANADILVCNSEHTKKDLLRLYGKLLKTEKVSVALLAVSKSFCPAKEQDIERAKAAYKINSDYFIVDGEPTKMMSRIFFYAIASLKKEIRIVSYGGTLTGYMMKICKKYGIRYVNISWLDEEDVPSILSGAKGLVFLSECEGFGLPILEAMACGTPVLCSNNTSLPEVGGDAVNYFTGYKYESIKKSLILFLQNSEQLIEAGIARSKLFSWKTTARKLVEAINV